MSTNRIKYLRAFVILILILLALQFELGMAVNLSPNLVDIPGVPFSVSGVVGNLQQVGSIALVHASLGIFLMIVTLANLVLSAVSKVRSALVFGSLGFLFIVLAAFNGIFFTVSGFQMDGFSDGMATSFILAFTFFFLELYNLKGTPRLSTGKE